jgi:PAS domain S-box-containing protein
MNSDEFSQHLAWVQARIDRLLREPGGDERNPRFMWEEAAQTLSVTFEELRVAEQEIRQQGEELEESRLRIEQERWRYRDLFDLAPVAYVVTDPAGLIREANRAASGLLNVERSYLTGKPLANYVAMEDRAAFRLGLVRLGQSEPAGEWAVRIEPRKGAAFDATLKISVEHDSVGSPIALRWTRSTRRPRGCDPAAWRRRAAPARRRRCGRPGWRRPRGG